MKWALTALCFNVITGHFNFCDPIKTFDEKTICEDLRKELNEIKKENNKWVCVGQGGRIEP